MPKYFFQIRRVTDSSAHEAFEAEHDDNNAARAAANRAMHEMATDVFELARFAELEISVRDQGGREIAQRWARFVAEDFD